MKWTHRPTVTTLLFFILIVCCTWTFVECGGGLFDHTDLPKLPDTDVIEIYHLRSFPLQLIATSIGTFSAQTSGLALRSQTTNSVIVLQYQPKNFGSCFLPKIRYLPSYDVNQSIVSADRVNLETMTKKKPPVLQSHSPTLSPTNTPDTATKIVLEWNKDAEISYSTEIDTLYWQQSTFLARINGVVYKNYVLWIEDFILQNRLYSPQSICSSEYEFSCYTYSVTWDTFLEESIKVFAGLSVRINAIIPPRATELRYLSSHEPIEVSIHHRRHKGDFWVDGGEANQSAANGEADLANTTQSGTASHYEDDARDDANAENLLPVRRHESTLRSFVHKQRRLGLRSNLANGDTNSSNNWTNSHEQSEVDEQLQAVSEDLIAYYRDIMACMQEFQLMDFTGALKSCSSENIAFVHIDGNRYYRITPRYPYVFVNEYLQYLPKPHYIGGHGIDIIDWVVLALIISVFVGGIVAALLKMQLIPVPESCVMGNIDSNHYWTRRLSRASYSSQPRNIFFRVWGALGWYTHHLRPATSKDGKGVYQHVNHEDLEDDLEIYSVR